MTAGRILGPRIYSTGPGVFSSENIRDLDHARNMLKRYSDYYDTKTLKQYVAGNREQRQWVIQAANELKLMPTTEGSLDIRMNITELIDGYSGHEHTIPTFPLQSGPDSNVRGVEDRVHADDPRGVRRAVGGELLVRDARPAQRREAEALHAVERSRGEDPASWRFDRCGDDGSRCGLVPSVAAHHEAGR